VDRRTKRRAAGAPGFTLVELLVVIAVLGLLSGVVVFAVGNLSGKSGAAACAADANVITTAEESYAAQHGQYTSESNLVSAGLLHDASTMHDVSLAAGSYDVVPVGQCVASGSAASPPGSGGSGTAGGVTLQLLSSSGVGLPGAQVDYLSGSWISVGTTGSDGSVADNLPDGTYQFRIDYRGETQTLPAAPATAATPVVVHTVPVTVQMTGGAGDHSGAAIAHRGNDGFWMTDDTTNGGGASALELLAGAYTFRADYHGETNLSSPTTVSSATTAAFPLTTVTVGAGEAAAAVEHRANNGAWISDGVTSSGNTATFDALAGTYSVRAHRHNGSQPQMDALVGGGSTSVNLP
jgi:prepilin-type N-terminal cleavage/methylation domain-containing protein